MKRATPSLTIVVLLTAVGHATSATKDADDVVQLMERARYWTAHGRADLARVLLRKVLAIDPQNPQVLAALGLGSGAGKAATSGLPSAAVPRRRNTMVRSQPIGHRATAATNGAAPLPNASRPDASAEAAHHRELAEEAGRAGRWDEALPHWTTALELMPNDPWLRLGLAKAYLQMDQAPAGAELMLAGVSGAPADAETAYAAALYFSAAGVPAQAQALLLKIPPLHRSASMTQLLTMLADRIEQQALELLLQIKEARLQSSLQDLWGALAHGHTREAVRLGESLQQAHPGRADVTRLLGLAQRDAGHYSAARFSLAQAQQQARQGPASLQWIAEESRNALRALDERKQPQITTGIGLLHKQGDPVLSQLTSNVQSLQLRWPQGDEGHWAAQLDRVHLNAGGQNLNALAAAKEWGTSALVSHPVGSFAVIAEASGTALALSYEAASWRADVGITPVGFRYSGLSGGLRFVGQRSGLGWELSLSHRPVTSSLLAYAGQRDEFSGETWGGVRRSEIDFNLEKTGAWLTPFARIGVAGYRGHGVRDNQEWRLGAGVGITLHRETSRLIRVNPTLESRGFANNQDHYSLGHGGYYSPQQSVSLSLPVQDIGRHGRLSWTLRGALSLSRTRTDSAERFPLNRRYQDLAQALGQGRYGAGGGTGLGCSVQSILEYRITSHWSTVVRFGVERSSGYRQDRLHIALRWYEKAIDGPVPLWPKALLPHGD